MIRRAISTTPYLSGHGVVTQRRKNSTGLDRPLAVALRYLVVVAQVETQSKV